MATEGPIDIFNENEVFEQLGKMGLDKATGPDDLPIEAVKIPAKQDIGYVVEAMESQKYGGGAGWCRYTKEKEIY